ncbi:MAG: helix-turn-helix domain-containing protein [Dysgonomonas sp.]|nr:helix-turn-helix domain-containing protein [Dysgonomonas sp.]
MKIITIDSEAYKVLVRKIDRVYNYIKAQSEKEAVPPPDPSEIWIGNDEAAEILEISLRTLQRLRSNGEITYSIRGGRTRYTLREIQRLIVGRVVVSKYRQEADLLRAHQEYQQRRTAGSINKVNK